MSKAIKYHEILEYGDINDRVIETIGQISPNKAFEVGYYNGSDKKKAIINVSPATGCPVGCNFCDLTDSGGPLSAELIVQQVLDMAKFVKKIDGFDVFQHPLKINFAKTGEPTLNPNIIDAMRQLTKLIPTISFKYSTSLPDTPKTQERINEIANFAAQYHGGSVQLQLSIISTDEAYRQNSVGSAGSKMKLLTLEDVSNVIHDWLKLNPYGRIPNASLLVGADTPCSPVDIANILRPGNIRFRIRKIVPTQHSQESGIQEASDQQIDEIIAVFKGYSYDINKDGIPTPTEAKHGLASNVTRRRVLESPFPLQSTDFRDNSKVIIPIHNIRYD